MLLIFEAEVWGVIIVIHLDWRRLGWCTIWFESDSTFVIDLLPNKFCKVPR